MILSVEGQEGTGKTSFAYTAPLPIVAFSLDMGHSRGIYGKLWPEFFDGLKIGIVPYVKPSATVVNGASTYVVKAESYEGNDLTVYELPTPLQMNPNRVEGFMAQWAYFLDIYVRAMQDVKVKTVVVDTMTLTYKNKCDAYLEELNSKGGNRKQLQQIEYGHPNEGIRTLYQFAKSVHKNLVVVHHLRDHYGQVLGKDGAVETGPDGTQELDGMKDTARYVDITLRTTKKDGKLTSYMNKCGPNLAVEGVPISWATWDKVMDVVEAGWYGPKFDRRKTEKENLVG